MKTLEVKVGDEGLESSSSEFLSELLQDNVGTVRVVASEISDKVVLGVLNKINDFNQKADVRKFVTNVKVGDVLFEGPYKVAVITDSGYFLQEGSVQRGVVGSNEAKELISKILSKFEQLRLVI